MLKSGASKNNYWKSYYIDQKLIGTKSTEEKKYLSEKIYYRVTPNESFLGILEPVILGGWLSAGRYTQIIYDYRLGIRVAIPEGRFTA